MYYNRNIKNLVFDLKSDVNYISILIIQILKILDCDSKKNSFKDFRKLNYIINFFTNNEDLGLLFKLLKGERLEKFEISILRNIYFKSKIEEQTYNTSIIILVNKKIIGFYKTKEKNNIFLLDNEVINGTIINNEILEKINKLTFIKEALYKWNYDKILEEISNLKEEV